MCFFPRQGVISGVLLGWMPFRISVCAVLGLQAFLVQACPVFFMKTSGSGSSLQGGAPSYLSLTLPRPFLFSFLFVPLFYPLVHQRPWRLCLNHSLYPQGVRRLRG